MPQNTPNLSNLLIGNDGEPSKLFKTLFTPRILGLFGLFALIGIVGLSILILPAVEKLQSSENKINIAKQQLHQKHQTLLSLKKNIVKLRGLPNHIQTLGKDESTALAAVSIRQHLKQMAQGKSKGQKVSSLPHPHNTRKLIRLLSQESVSEPFTPANPILPKLSVERHPYQITLEGTYPALIEFINAVTDLPNSLSIEHITLKPVNSSTEENHLSKRKGLKSKDTVLNMTITLSAYFHKPQQEATKGKQGSHHQ